MNTQAGGWEAGCSDTSKKEHSEKESSISWPVFHRWTREASVSTEPTALRNAAASREWWRKKTRFWIPCGFKKSFNRRHEDGQYESFLKREYPYQWFFNFLFFLSLFSHNQCWNGFQSGASEALMSLPPLFHSNNSNSWSQFWKIKIYHFYLFYLES